MLNINPTGENVEIIEQEGAIIIQDGNKRALLRGDLSSEAIFEILDDDGQVMNRFFCDEGGFTRAFEAFDEIEGELAVIAGADTNHESWNDFEEKEFAENGVGSHILPSWIEKVEYIGALEELASKKEPTR